ncbi:hypothetical protein RCH23_001956 [Cryobacterium sp. CAN_C3]|nr:hypothetical protein [Cryobacterium sp. CAN_C3]
MFRRKPVLALSMRIVKSSIDMLSKVIHRGKP